LITNGCKDNNIRQGCRLRAKSLLPFAFKFYVGLLKIAGICARVVENLNNEAVCLGIKAGIVRRSSAFKHIVLVVVVNLKTVLPYGNQVVIHGYGYGIGIGGIGAAAAGIGVVPGLPLLCGSGIYAAYIIGFFFFTVSKQYNGGKQIQQAQELVFFHGNEDWLILLFWRKVKKFGETGGVEVSFPGVL